MNNAMKGILFSALIFPGAGQIILARYRRGGLFFAIAFISGIACVAAVVHQSVALLQDSLATGVAPSIPTVMAIVMDAAGSASSLFMKVSLLILICSWLLSALDAWRIGADLDRRPAVS